jgi:His-Xaa-Ser system protein HxsD
MKMEINNNEIILVIDKNIYNEDVLHKCFYWYGANFNVEISNNSAESFLVRLIAKHENENLQEALEKVQRDLIDFKLRDIVTKETKTIRELLIAKAFAYYGLDENPTTEISDPVGFNPENVLAK